MAQDLTTVALDLANMAQDPTALTVRHQRLPGHLVTAHDLMVLPTDPDQTNMAQEDPMVLTAQEMLPTAESVIAMVQETSLMVLEPVNTAQADHTDPLLALQELPTVDVTALTTLISLDAMALISTVLATLTSIADMIATALPTSVISAHTTTLTTLVTGSQRLPTTTTELSATSAISVPRTLTVATIVT
jgi:hypothetical protein